MLSRAGFDWYEVSNWAKPGGQCRPQLGLLAQLRLVGHRAGCAQHVGGVRWWNVKHPTAYTSRVSAGVSPGHAREILDASTQRVERVLLQLRLVEGS